MLSLLLTSLLVAQSAAPAPPPTTTPPTKPSEAIQVLLLDLSAIDVSADKVKLLSGRLAASMGNRGLEVLTRSDLRTMASLEADKAAVGCDEGSQSCLAEIAQALGARLVVSGQVGALDDVIFLQLSLFDSEVGRAVAREEARGKTLTEVADAIPDVVDRLMAPVLGTPVASAPADGAGAGVSPLVVGGGVAAGVGALAAIGLGLWAVSLDGTLGEKETAGADKQFAYDNGAFVVVGAGAGAVLAVAGAGALALGLVSE